MSGSTTSASSAAGAPPAVPPVPPVPAGGGVLGRVPAPALFLVSGLAQYGGAALAVALFAVVPSPTVAWLRIAVAALVLLAWRRPWRARWTRADLLAAALFGVVLAAMNVSFYVAIDVLPLGTAVAIEFLGPVAVAAVTGRTWRERLGIVVAAVGVVLLAGVELSTGGEDSVRGLVAIGIAAACWAGYILLGRRVAQGSRRGDAGAPRPDGITSLAVGMAAGGLVFAPFLAGSAGPVLHDAGLAAAVLGIAVLSSVVPYAIEQVVLRRVTAATFAVLLAMLPATAAVVGAVALRQWPHGWEVAGLACVSVAIVLTATRRAPAGRERAA
ncbi:conserved hypthetical membrane protein [Cellulomonas hominis]|uniref:Conserved hypthetical membrane protein n=1 Tax=Cellulomonas hominis TaxID=156981 RepID=A0A511FA07_9CELL|nr:inner membrane transporter RhtA [Cellulomonas hominis]GEL45384.1 conserved hypthetical membrane protein [Cellulomonas hominis]